MLSRPSKIWPFMLLMSVWKVVKLFKLSWAPLPLAFVWVVSRTNVALPLVEPCVEAGSCSGPQRESWAVEGWMTYDMVLPPQVVALNVSPRKQMVAKSTAVGPVLAYSLMHDCSWALPTACVAPAPTSENLPSGQVVLPAVPPPPAGPKYDLFQSVNSHP